MAKKFRSYPMQAPREEEEDRYAKADRLNEQANEYYRLRKQSIDVGDDGSSQAMQRRLAIAFDYNPADPPPLKQLMDKFHRQSPEVQAGMFQKGMAPVSAATGEKLLHNVGKSVADVRENAVDYFGKKILSGEIEKEIINGKPAYFDIVTDEVEDYPGGPKKKVKKKVPVTAGALENINAGVRQGRIQDPLTEKWAEAEALKPERSAQSRMSSEEFQKILDARQAADPYTSISKTSPMMSILHGPERPPTPARVLSSAPSVAANLGWIKGGGPERLSENIATNMSSVGNVAYDALAAVANLSARAGNAYNRFMEGDRAEEIPLLNMSRPAPIRPNPRTVDSYLANARPNPEYDYDINAGMAW